MLIVSVNGGLGNQMFQYAFGRAMSLNKKEPLKLDLLEYGLFQNNHTRREYGLEIFKIVAEPATKKEVMLLADSNPFINLLNKYLRTNISPFSSSCIRESDLKVDLKKLSAMENIYLRGYWQSEKYFKQYRNLLLKEFVFPKKISRKNNSVLKIINSSNSISIHVRRGDYVSDSKTNKYHGLCGIDYYIKAINYFNKSILDPQYFVFSDDIMWCKAHFPKMENVNYISHNQGNKSWEDMRLMSNCKYNIIANSSFSWWGAWLNNYDSKIVIAPKKWFADQKANTTDIIPGDWVKM